MIDLDDMVAAPGRRPLHHQASAPVLGPKPAVTNSPDLQRILALPRRAPLEIGSPESLALRDRVSSKLRKPDGPCVCRKPIAEGGFNRECILSLREIQAQALWEIYKVGGMLGAIAVGAGKTIINLLAPMVLRDCKTALLLVPSTLTEQLVRDYRLLAQHWRVPSLVMQTRGGWSDIIGGPTLHVLPYSLLQRPDFTTWIAELKPDVIIADEADKLRGFGDRQTATSSRVWRAFADAPSTRFIPSSGSLTEAKLDDYAHLAMIALGDGSPLPHDREVVKEWGGAIDADVGCPAHPGALLELCEPGVEDIRAGFHRRLVETAGVIRTESSGVDGVALEILDREVRAPQVIEGALADLRATWVRPDGEELVDAMQVKRCAREIASGFHYYWFFPRGEPTALVEDWLEARKEWHCELRDKLKSREEHLDSPLLCARAARRAWGDEPITREAVEVELEADEMERDTARKRKRVQGNAHLPTWKANAWPRWRDIRDQVQPTTRTQRIDDYLVTDAAAWAESHRGIVWYEHSAFGEWLAEISGLTMHGGGPGAGERLAAEDGRRSIICSIKSHGRGRDGLQRLFWEQLVANPMTGASAWEQLLGRLHRIGQTHPLVSTWVYRHTLEMREAVDKAKARGEYITGTLGAAQKLTGALR